MTKPLRLIFAGTPDFAVCHLEQLLHSKHEIIAVYTQPDRKAGRGQQLTASPVKTLAIKHKIPVYQPVNFRDDKDREQLASLGADLMVVVAYGLLLPQAVLDIPPMGCINVHGSILPRWRGAAPIQRSIWAGDQITGITIMKMDVGMDTGDMLRIITTPIEPQDTSASMYEKLATLGANALADCITDLVNGLITPEKQNNAHATYAKKLTKEESIINWHDDAIYIERCIRAFNPWPISSFSIADQSIKLWQAHVLESDHKVNNINASAGTIVHADKTGIYVQTGNGILVLDQMQLAGKKIMPVQDILNAKVTWFSVGTKLNVDTAN